MNLGFAVKVLGADLPSHDARRWQSGPHLRVSLERLTAILRYCGAHPIRMYRMVTALAPYASHPDLPQFRSQPAECADERVQRLAVEELEVQAELLDGMGAGPEAVVVLHVGGAAGGKEAAMDRFLRGFSMLSGAAQTRLVVENDDRSFGLRDVLGLSERIGRPVVWDILHHHCCDPDGIPDRGLDLDVMLEAKGKDLALLRLRDQLAGRASRWGEDHTLGACAGDPPGSRIFPCALPPSHSPPSPSPSPPRPTLHSGPTTSAPAAAATRSRCTASPSARCRTRSSAATT